jgi:hypothetical protein
MKYAVIIAIGLAATRSLLASPSMPAAQATGSAATGESADAPAAGSGVSAGGVPVGEEGSGAGSTAPATPVATRPAPPGAAPPEPARVMGRSRFLFPSLQLTASTDASAKFKVAFGYAVGNAGPGNVTIWPRLETTSSKGVSTLFSSDDETLPVQLGLVVNYSLPERGLSENTDAERAALSHVYDMCADRCAADPKCPFKRTDSDDIKASATIKQLVNGKCTDAAELWAEYERALSTRRSFPRLRISGGGSYVTQELKYLTGAPGPMILRDEKTEKHTAFRLAAAADYTWPGSEGAGWILEGRASYSQAWNASSTTVRSCTPEGSLSADSMSTLELCKDKTIGAPTKKQLATFELTFGAGDTERQSYRWAAGVFTTIPIGKDRNSIGLELPVYLSFATNRAPAGYTGDYKGFLRITPQIQWTRRDDHTLDHVILLVVEALGQRAYFPDALD